MSHPAIITGEHLKEAMGYQNMADVEKKLVSRGIRFFPGKPGHIWTTLDLINAAGGLSPTSNEEKETSNKIF